MQVGQSQKKYKGVEFRLFQNRNAEKKYMTKSINIYNGERLQIQLCTIRNLAWKKDEKYESKRSLDPWNTTFDPSSNASIEVTPLKTFLGSFLKFCLQVNKRNGKVTGTICSNHRDMKVSIKNLDFKLEDTDATLNV